MCSSLIVYGDALVEISALVKSLPGHGEDAIADVIKFLPGGSAANCAVIAARLGINVKFIGLVGHDYFGNYILNDLSSQGVDISKTKIINGNTATVVVVIDRTGERTMISYRGVAANVPYGSIDDPIFEPGDILHISGYAFQTHFSRETAFQLIEKALKKNVKISIDPSFNFAKRMISDYRNLFSQVDYFFPNESEALLISQSPNAKDAINCLHKLGTHTVLLKLGADGCYISTPSETKFQNAYYNPNVIDTTGAGDAFAGGYLAATLKGLSPTESTMIGCATAAIVVGELGGHSAAPNISHLIKFAQNQKVTSLLQAVEKFSA